MGSGSTGIACINTGRKFIGYEIDDEYFEIAKERLEETIAEKCLIDCESITTTKNG
ncbi:MAG: DNA methyltransferase [Treponemataceae bacterium]